MKYLNRIVDQEIRFHRNGKQNLLQAYCDADFADDRATRRRVQLDTLYSMEEEQ